MPRPRAVACAIAVTVVSALAPAAASAQLPAIPGITPVASDDPAISGAFAPPFTPSLPGQGSAKCVARQDGSQGPPGGQDCKPAGATVSVLPDGRIFYWDALEGTENIKTSIVLEYGHVSANDQSRLLDLSGAVPALALPQHANGGANPNGNPDTDPLVPGTQSTETYNDGALFCSDQLFLPDGRVLATGGTDYYDDPHVTGTQYGVAELQGLRNTRIFDPATNDWTQSGDTETGRWYPTVVQLGALGAPADGGGGVLIASGVKKLLKPVYAENIQGSGTNVETTETYDVATGKWTPNGAAGMRSLPLFPRLHVLPDGRVFYDAAGQTFNPFGQSYDEALWNDAASYDPQSKTWHELGIPGIGTTVVGFRGSTFSTMLPLVPDAQGNYPSASFLEAGGTLGVTPGSNVATDESNITTVQAPGPIAAEKMTSEQTGPLPQGRWYSSGVLLPTGTALAFSGADRDEVETPGTEIPRKQAALFDPATRTWRPLATAMQARTYHNTAVLLPDATVLVGGHAPISTLYASNTTLPGGVTAPNEGRDPSFEVFRPPYLFWGPQPKILEAPSEVQYGKTVTVTTDTPADQIASVVLVHNPSLTHLVDANQRNVELRILSRSGTTLTVAEPPNANVAPAGPYMLFANKRVAQGLIPSHAGQLFVGRQDAPGTATLHGPSGCVRRNAPASVTGASIDTVTFRVDGRNPLAQRAGTVPSLSVLVRPRALKVGLHRLTATVHFLAGSGTPDRVLSLTFRKCAKGAVRHRRSRSHRHAARRRHPRFTG